MAGSKEYQKQWQLENKERVRKTKQEYYLRNKKEINEKNKTNAIQWRINNPDLAMLNSAKHRSRINNLPFDLELIDIDLPTHCPVLGIPLVTHAGKGKNIQKDSYSLDRIDPSKGYTKGNVQVISGLANRMKQNATPEELLLFAEWVFKTYKESK